MSIDLIALGKAIKDEEYYDSLVKAEPTRQWAMPWHIKPILLACAKAYLEEHKTAQELVDWCEGINTKEKLDQALKQ